MENNQWQKNRDLLTTQYFDGEKYVTKYISPALETRGITESYAGFKRETRITKDESEIEVNIYNRETGVATQIFTNPDSILVFFKENQSKPVIGEAIYGLDGRINSVTVQAEAQDFEIEAKDSYSNDWKENIAVLNNLLLSEENIGMQIYYEETFNQIIGSTHPEDPTVKLINELSDYARDQILDTFSNEKEKYSAFYNDFLGNIVKWHLFEEAKVGRKDISRYKKNIIHLISQTVKNELAHLRFIDNIMRPQFSRRLELSSFTEDGYEFQEQDIEESRTEAQKKDIVRKQGSFYGSEVTVQDSNFIVDRQDSSLNITCKDDKGVERWVLSLPVSCDVESIQSVSRDQEADFRKIKDLFPSSFAMSK